MPMEVLFYVDELLNCGLFHLPSFLGRSTFLFTGLWYNAPGAAVSEFAEFHSDLLPKGKRPTFSKRIDNLHEATKQFFGQHFLCKAISGVQDEVY